jgi:two-component system cell cycle response regulator DivK
MRDFDSDSFGFRLQSKPKNQRPKTFLFRNMPTELTAPTGRDGRHTILVVDDFDDTRWLLRTWLERKGFRVIEAENGNEAVSEAQTESPDLIIMDLEMPELDGLAATRQIRGLTNALAGVPIVAVSAYGAEQYRAPALQAGCNEYVSTPFEPADLERLIRSYMH